MQKKRIRIIGILVILIILIAGGSYFIMNSKDKNINNNEVVENNINDSKLNKNQDESQNNTQNSIQEDDQKNKESLESKENKETISSEKSDKSENKDDNKVMQNDSKDNMSNKFSFDKAIEICKKKYGEEPDTVYTGSHDIQNLNGKSGYIIQVKSKEMMKQGGTGVLFSVLVTSNGEIVEME